MNGENELPEGWDLVKLPAISQINMGQSPPGTTYNKNGLGLPFFQGKIDFTDYYPKIRVFCTEPKKIANPGDILLCVRAPVGPTNIANCTCAIGRGLAALAPLGGIPTEFILNYLRLMESELESYGTGSTFTAITKKTLEEFDIPLPPLAEQRRIVAAVEALLDKVNASRERLDRVPGLLKAFREAVLAAACSGRLTEGLREEKNFEKSISQIEINQNDTIISPKIPATWQITQLSKLTDLTSGFAFKKSEYSQNGIRLLQIANVSFGKIIWDDLAYLPHNYLEKYPNLCLKPGDILMALNRPILGNNLKIGILKNSDTPAILYQRVGRFDVFNQDFKPYLYLFLNSPFFISNLQKDLQGVDQPFIRKPKLLNFWVPLPPLSEQHEIVRRVESLFALADNIEQRVAAAKERADRLTQAILAKAFRGELVPTEAELARKEGREYEPASVLLERIREEREAEDLKKKRSSRKRAARKSS